MLQVITIVITIYLCMIPAIAQQEGISDWTPDKNQFRLYVNLKGESDNLQPSIDILDDKGSWPFSMKYASDTVYLYIVPPGYELEERAALDSLPAEFPLVVKAGTERAVFWFLYDSGQVSIDTMEPAPFISVIDVQPIPDNVVFIQLYGDGPHSNTIKVLVNTLDGKAKLTQLDKGFYRGVWYYVTKTGIRRWKLNKIETGLLLAFQLIDPALRTEVKSILDKFR